MAQTRRAPEAWVDRFLAALDGDDPATAPSKVRAFQGIFVLILCVEYWARATPTTNDLGVSSWVVLPLVSALGVVTLSPRWGRLGFVGLAAAQCVRLWNDFPGAGNHSYLELFLCLLCAFIDVRERDERTLFLRSVRWMTCVVFFYAGLQKLVHGYYFRGELLAYSLGIEAFKPVLRLLLPQADFVRLSQYHGKAGDGPYLLSSWGMLALSNGTYLFEMGLVPLLVWRRTRQFAVVAGLLFVCAIETVARELFFGLIYVNMLLLFTHRDVHRRAVGVFAVVLACMLLVRFKVLPEVIFY